MPDIALAAEIPDSLDDGTGGRLEARYGQAFGGLGVQAARQAGAHWNPVLDTLLDHRSVRNFLSRPLPLGALQVVVAAAQSAPSSSNMQAWSVVAVELPERKAELAQLCGGQKHIAQAPIFLVWVADLARHAAIAQAQGAPTEGLDYLETFLTAAIDVGLAAQNAVGALEALGLGCVYIGAVRNRPEAVAEFLQLPPHAAPILGLCVGWPNPETPTAVKPRLPQSAVLHSETYDRDQLGRVNGYDETLRAFQNGQGLKAAGWTPSVMAKVANGEVLNGRDRLSAALKRLGFPLR